MNLSHVMRAIAERFSYGPRLRPDRDWLTLLTLAALAFIVMLVWNLWAFSTVAGGGTFGGAAPAVPQVFSQQSLDTIHTIFSERNAEELKYATGVYRFADPSQ